MIRVRLLTGMALLIATAGAGFAQDNPRGELYLGYPLLAGFHGSAAVNINRWFGIVGDYSYRVAEYYADKPLHTFGVGPRLAVRSIPRVTPFAHALFGGAGSGCAGWSNSAGCQFGTSFAMVLGGGVDVRLGRHLSIRAIQLDRIRTSFGGGNQNYNALSFGLTFRLGKI